MLTDRRAMPNLHQIVDFNAASNASFTDAGAVHAGIRLHFNVAFQYRRAGLGDLLPALSVAGKAEAVASDDSAILQDDVVTEGAVLAYDGVGMREEMTSNARATINDHVRQDHGVVANLDVFVNHDIGRNVRALANSRSGCDHSRGMHPGFIQRGPVEEIDRPGECQVRILAAQHARRDGGEVLGNDHRGGSSGLGRGSIFRIGDKSNLPVAGLFDSGDARDLGVGIPVFQRGAEGGRNFSKFHSRHVSRSRDFATNRISTKQRYLPRVLWTSPATLRLLVANDRDHRHFSQRGAGNKNPLRVGAGIGRNDGKAVAPFLQ